MPNADGPLSPLELGPRPAAGERGPANSESVRRVSECQGLLERARAGSNSALGQLLDNCRDYLLLVANQEVASDIRQKVAPSDLVQETLAEACQGFGNFAGEDPSELLAWLRRILLNNVVDVTRGFRQAAKRDISRELPLDAHESQELILQQLIAEQSSPSGHVMAVEESELLLASLARLPEHYREVIQRRNLEFQSFVEIGRQMDLSADAARKLWDRAIERLSSELSHIDGEP